MAVPKTLSGARAKVFINDEGDSKLIGVFNSISYGVTNGVQPIYVLGAYAPVASEYTHQEPVSIEASGWRSMDFGPYEHMSFPKLQDLMNQGYITFHVHDRQTNRQMATIHKVRPESFGTGLAARQLEEVRLRYVGLLHDDEFSGPDGPGQSSHESHDADDGGNVSSIWGV